MNYSMAWHNKLQTISKNGDIGVSQLMPPLFF